ncbi:MAG TPA: FAD-binding oxidoreductase [Bdellovibrionota bacterium]|nr:FAD-binding oxidoreductase [Bdellovibrionota bacterium]
MWDADATLIRDLRLELRGEVWEQEERRAAYSTDESIFSIFPLAVVLPADEEDVRALLQIASRHGVPLTARGGGSSTAGQAIGPGLVVDFSRHFNRILSISENSAVVQPGVVLEDLNRELAGAGRRFAPDPSSRAYCTLGGMVANNASGPHAYKFGATRNHVRRLRLVLADGRIAESTEVGSFFPSIIRSIVAARNRIESRIPKTRKNASGYHVSTLIPPMTDLTPLLVGSEGTLALTTEIELATVPLPEKCNTAVFSFDSLSVAVAAAEPLRSSRPAAIELVDRYILKAMQTGDAGFIDSLGLTTAQASLWVEWEGEIPSVLRKEAAALLENSDVQKHLWALRSDASKILHAQPGARRPLRCVEDGVVPTDRLGTYVTELREILRRHDCDGAIFGHAGDGNIHVNPNVDVGKPRLPARIESLMNDVYDLIFRLEGSISGEHGDGLLRKNYMARQWGDLLPLFREIKAAFDPRGILNPDKKLPDGEFRIPGFRELSREAAPICLVRQS